MDSLFYPCDHLCYNSCTLFLQDEVGLAVIQQRYNPRRKWTWWGAIDKELEKAIINHPEFDGYFRAKALPCMDNLYPTVTVRQVMWALRLPPLKKAQWETRFF